MHLVDLASSAIAAAAQVGDFCFLPIACEV